MKYVYPAIFTNEEDGIIVVFSDFESCYTSGVDLIEAMEMAQDVLSLTLYDLEELQITIPIPSNIKDIKVKENSFVSYIECDTNEYRKMNDNKAVKKTLTIPSWLNDEAIKRDINFSQTLQEALVTKLQLN